MLVHASRTATDAYQDLVRATLAIFFLGTPHSGSILSTHGENAIKVLRVLGFTAASQNLEILKPNNASLDLLQEDFHALLMQQLFEVLTFQEAHGATKFSGILSEKVNTS